MRQFSAQFSYLRTTAKDAAVALATERLLPVSPPGLDNANYSPVL